MPRKLLPLLLALALLLCACAKQPDEKVDPAPVTPGVSDDGPDAPPEEESFSFDELSVEFVIGERSVDDLARLQSELPGLLSAALEKHRVGVGRVRITFGASAEATAEALRAGNVQVGFLPAETYFAHEDALFPAAVGTPGTGVALTCGDSPAAQRIRAAAADGTLTWEMLSAATWFFSADEASEAWLDAYLAANFDGHGADELNITRPARDADGNFAMADVACDLYVLPFAPEGGAPEDAIALGVLYAEMAAVSAADGAAGSAAFARALGAALEEAELLDALALYGTAGYAAADGADLEATRLVCAQG